MRREHVSHAVPYNSIMSHRITLSVFLFLDKHPDLSFEWLEDAFGFSGLNYDQDMCEMGGSNAWNRSSLASAFKPMSWSEHWADKALAQAGELGIEKCRRALLVPWHKYEPRKLKRNRPEDPVMIGPFEFEDLDILC